MRDVQIDLKTNSREVGLLPIAVSDNKNVDFLEIYIDLDYSLWNYRSKKKLHYGIALKKSF